MRDILSWSLSLGRVGGVQVRIHAFFLLVAAFILQQAALFDHGRLLWYGMSMIAVLLASVALHEWAHCAAAEKLEGQMQSAILWPGGGLVAASVPPDPVAEALVALAGPGMNIFLCSLAALVLQARDRTLVELLNPLAPPFLSAREEMGLPWISMLECAFWINWVLALVNLLPAHPFDGARAVKAGLWYALGRRSASYLTALLGQATAVGMWFAAWWLATGEYSAAAMPLVLLGCFLFFSAHGETERVHDPLGEEWTLGDELAAGINFDPPREPEPRRPGPLRQWIENCRVERRRKQLQQEEDEERRVDAILARLHETGIDGLAPQERALLQRVSVRYRNRLDRSS